jgi:transcriptional regulator with XRE-family HTH domain
MQYPLEYKIVDAYTRPDNCRMNIQNIAGRLDAAMQARKVKTQTRLAKLSGIPQPTIARILKGGGRQGPETETLRSLANALQVHLRWLQEGLGPMDLSDEAPAAPSDTSNTPGSTAMAREVAEAAEDMLGHVADLVDTYRLAGPDDRERIDLIVQRVRRKLSTVDKSKSGSS